MRFLSIIVGVFIFMGCSIDPKIKPIIPANNIKEIIPEGWPTPYYNFNYNPLTPDGFILGRTLFYDPIFSSDNTISCGSCHQQYAGFANGGHDLSHGVNGLLGKRNTPALQNLNWSTSFLHDGGITNIELFPPAPITNPIEMNETMANVVSKISNSGKYTTLFTKAFGDGTVNTQRILKAMAQFMGTMYSYNSKYDKVKKGLESFTSQEQSGYNIFVQNCANCHKEPLFSDYSFKNNGIGVNPALKDSGRMHITQLITDIYKFKTPSLRNIEKTAPYMHDGRYTTLDACLNHYASNIANSSTLDPQLVGGIALSAQDKIDVISFLKTLTDNTFLTDKRFAENP
jgi:cytochrome c peroxidase